MSESTDKHVLVRVTSDGPYLVTGGIPLLVMRIDIDENGDSVDWVPGAESPVDESYSLCRCGRSKSRPFCDGGHVHG